MALQSRAEFQQRLDAESNVCKPSRSDQHKSVAWLRDSKLAETCDLSVASSEYSVAWLRDSKLTESCDLSVDSSEYRKHRSNDASAVAYVAGPADGNGSRDGLGDENEAVPAGGDGSTGDNQVVRPWDEGGCFACWRYVLLYRAEEPPKAKVVSCESHKEEEVPFRRKKGKKLSKALTPQGTTALGTIRSLVTGHLTGEDKCDFYLASMIEHVNLQGRYDIIRQLGSGVQGTTHLVKRKDPASDPGASVQSPGMDKSSSYKSGASYVAKISDTSHTGSDGVMKEEFEILRRLRHPNCLKVIELLRGGATIESPNSLCIISELAAGGDLYKYLEGAGHECFDEKHFSDLLRQAMCGVAFLHERLLVHNDLKPDNIFVMESYSPGKTPRVLIGDFGMATCLSGIRKFGDLRYMPPESVRQIEGYKANPRKRMPPVSFSVDIWSMGVTTYELLSGGMYPFLYEKCNKDGYEPLWAKLKTEDAVLFRPHLEVSHQAELLMAAMLDKDVQKRATAKDALDQDWFQPEGKSPLKQSVKTKLKFTASRNKARQMLLNVMTKNLRDEHKERCNKIFEKFDLDGSGQIDRAEFKSALELIDERYLVNADAIFDRADINDDGYLDIDEFGTLTFDWRSVDNETLDSLLEDFLLEIGTKEDGTIDQKKLEERFQSPSFVDTILGSAISKTELMELGASHTASGVRQFVKQGSFFTLD